MITFIYVDDSYFVNYNVKTNSILLTQILIYFNVKIHFG